MDTEISFCMAILHNLDPRFGKKRLFLFWGGCMVLYKLVIRIWWICVSHVSLVKMLLVLLMSWWVWMLLGAVGVQSQGIAQAQAPAPAQGQDSSSNPWRQMIQWENNGRVFSLLNSGAEYVPARGQEQDRSHRVLLADSPHRRSRTQGGNVRRQAPSRGASETVRGQARHPFGFGQVPENWRQGTTGTGESSRFQSSSSTRYRTPSGSSSSSSSSASSSSSNVAPYPQYPFQQQPPYPIPYDPQEPPFRGTGYPTGTGGGFTGGGYAGGGYSVGSYGGGGFTGGGLAPVPPRSDFTDDSYRYYPPYGQQYPAFPAQPAPPFSDGLDRRYTHSLYSEDTGSFPDTANAAGPVSGGASAGVGTAGQPALQSPQYEQFPPFGRPQPLPPFIQQPARNPLTSNVAENPSVSVGSVYRPQQRGTVLNIFVFIPACSTELPIVCTKQNSGCSQILNCKLNLPNLPNCQLLMHVEIYCLYIFSVHEESLFYIAIES